MPSLTVCADVHVGLYEREPKPVVAPDSRMDDGAQALIDQKEQA